MLTFLFRGEGMRKRGIVYGVGINDGSRPSTEGKKKLKVYNTWQGMLERCFSATYQSKYPTYIGCKLSENFKHYSYFYDWYNQQTGCNTDGWELDKDILSLDCKLYSEDTCVIVPKEINSLFTKRENGRGDYPIGVSLKAETGRYSATCSKGKGNLEYLGYYDDPHSAFLAYKKFKESYIKQIAEKWFGKVSDKVYWALMKYEVKLTD